MVSAQIERPPSSGEIMPITEFVPSKSDDDETLTELETYCVECERLIVLYRGWTELETQNHVGRFMHLIPTWISKGVPAARAVTRMIGGNPALGYR